MAGFFKKAQDKQAKGKANAKEVQSTSSHTKVANMLLHPNQVPTFTPPKPTLTQQAQLEQVSAQRATPGAVTYTRPANTQAPTPKPDVPSVNWGAFIANKQDLTLQVEEAATKRALTPEQQHASERMFDSTMGALASMFNADTQDSYKAAQAKSQAAAAQKAAAPENQLGSPANTWTPPAPAA